MESIIIGCTNKMDANILGVKDKMILCFGITDYILKLSMSLYCALSCYYVFLVNIQSNKIVLLNGYYQRLPTVRSGMASLHHFRFGHRFKCLHGGIYLRPTVPECLLVVIGNCIFSTNPCLQNNSNRGSCLEMKTIQEKFAGMSLKQMAHPLDSQKTGSTRSDPKWQFE